MEVERMKERSWFCGVALRENWSECSTAQLSLSGRTVRERILDFDCCATAGEFGGTLKGFTGAGISGYGSLGISTRKLVGISYINIIRSAHTPSSVKQNDL